MSDCTCEQDGEGGWLVPTPQDDCPVHDHWEHVDGVLRWAWWSCPDHDDYNPDEVDAGCDVIVSDTYEDVLILPHDVTVITRPAYDDLAPGDKVDSDSGYWVKVPDWRVRGFTGFVVNAAKKNEDAMVVQGVSKSLGAVLKYMGGI